ncbi:MAG: pyridoxamine 5'-phosphate oxidase family protein [Clostridia bacterium]|nr:pyridoxamine 5'-phosphate oxidase family protein [Oscillospiraceae bacterium]MBQ1954746.1 pyridoxamine 5'-phosphate oxidase family protein [Clostridia bacterium]
MEKLNQESNKIMIERFAKDNIIALATSENGMPSVRYVNAYYEDGAFYVITYALSGKMKQIEKNPVVAIAGDWFTARGKGVNLGYFGKAENKNIAEKLKKAFYTWIDNGHNNFDDENTCILCIELTDGVLFSHGKRYHIDFTAE